MSYIVSQYNQHVKWRAACGEQFGSIHQLPILKIYKTLKGLIGESNGLILDFGCGVAKNHKKIYGIEDGRYLTLDNDPDGTFDFQSIKDIPKSKKFDIVILSEVIEHIPFNECMQLVADLSSVITSGGRIFVTVPNIHHPVRYWGDIDHVTPWSFEDLYGLFRNIGFEVAVLGRFNKHRYPINPVRRFIVQTVCNVFRVDWCDSIIGIAKKP